jgi:hypothetical protein
MESDDIKYVLNMIISAVDLDKLSDEDIDDIGKKFERDFSKGEESDDSEGSDESSDDQSSDGEEDLNEEDPMSKLNEFINDPAPTDAHEIDLNSYSELGEKKKPSSERPPIGSHGETHLEEDEFNLDEIKNEIHRTIGKTLSKYFK